MWFYIKLAWRNVLRNKRRTIIAGIAIGIGLACLIFYDGLIIGMEDVAIRSATDSFIGEAQIHREGFQSSRRHGFNHRPIGSGDQRAGSGYLW